MHLVSTPLDAVVTAAAAADGACVGVIYHRYTPTRRVYRTLVTDNAPTSCSDYTGDRKPPPWTRIDLPLTIISPFVV